MSALGRTLCGILIGVGILVAGLSGLCSVMVILSAMPLSPIDLREGLPIVLLVGGVPFALGLLAVWGGRRMLRNDRGGDPPGDIESPPGGMHP